MAIIRTAPEEIRTCPLRLECQMSVLVLRVSDVNIALENRAARVRNSVFEVGPLENHHGVVFLAFHPSPRGFLIQVTSRPKINPTAIFGANQGSRVPLLTRSMSALSGASVGWGSALCLTA